MLLTLCGLAASCWLMAALCWRAAARGARVLPIGLLLVLLAASGWFLARGAGADIHDGEAMDALIIGLAILVGPALGAGIGLLGAWKLRVLALLLLLLQVFAMLSLAVVGI